jgi:Uma2 family endonuclease
MSQSLLSAPPIETLADLWDRLGNVPLERIRFHPAPGTATEEDVVAAAEAADKRLCELVDGVLVEKAMGFFESRLAAVLIQLMGNHVSAHDLGIVLAPDGTLRLEPGLVRIPDVAFFSWDQFPNRTLPRAPIPDLAPDLAVEILSQSNTPREMERKLHDYFRAGAKLVWYVDPERRTATVYTAPDQSTVVAEDGVLDGGGVLPGFRLSLKDWFAQAGERGSV